MKKNIVLKRMLSCVVAATMIASPVAAFATESNTEEANKVSVESNIESDDEISPITELMLIDEDDISQTVELNDYYYLPDELWGRLGNTSQVTEVDVDYWVDENNNRVTDYCSTLLGKGTHKFKAVIESDEYLKEGVESPTITVKVTKVRSHVSGKWLHPTKKAGTTLIDHITIRNSGGRTLYLQKYENGKWRNKKSFKTADVYSQVITVTYPSNWWKGGNSKWRFRMYSTDNNYSYKSYTIWVTPTRYYQMPSKYFQLSDGVTLKESGGYTLYKGYMGLKTRMVNTYFGLGDYNWPRYTDQTKAAVKKFQSAHGLEATGNCNKATWLMIGTVQKKNTGKTSFTEYNWYHKGAYVHPCEIDMSYTKSECIETFIDTAYEYLGDPYVVGTAGKPGQGCDCSGLVIQAAYSCGIDLSPTSVVRHAKPAYEYESRTLYNTSKLKTVSWSNRKRGDLIFYKKNGVIIHVAIYLGNNKIIHSWPNKVQVSSVYGWGDIAGVKRVFS